MVSTYRRSGPPRIVIVVLGMGLVFSCYLMWNGFIDFLEAGGDRNVAATQAAESRRDTPTFAPPTVNVGPSPSPYPSCINFEVWAASGTIRECPDFSCERRDTLYYEDQVCVYGVAEDDDFFSADEWYLIDLNPNGAFRDLAYMHESVLRALNPTPRPSRTYTPLPTVTLTPTRVTDTPAPSATPNPQTPPTATPTPPITPTLTRREF